MAHPAAAAGYDHGPGLTLRLPRLTVQSIGRGLVALAMLAVAVVFTEPAPVDLVMLAVIVMVPFMGLVRITRGLAVIAAVSLVPVAAAFIGVLQAIEMKTALTHTAVTLFLVAGALVIAAFVMASPLRHARLVMSAYTVGAVVTAALGIAGYLGLFPGAFELFTKFSRASGTFKDPNVFGPYLVLPVLYLLTRLLDGSTRFKPVLAAAAGVLALGVLFSVSRGAWFCLAFGVALTAALLFMTAETPAARARIVISTVAAAIGVAAIVVVALQFDNVASLIADRATLTQSYDEGPEGRFGGQQKAKALILANPLGIGAQQFGVFYHLEEAHNVYLSMFMNAGWLGGLLFIVIVLGTLAVGLAASFRRAPTQPLLIAAFAAFAGHAAEGLIIDLDHWRHFHLLMALVWGLSLWREPVAARWVHRNEK